MHSPISDMKQAYIHTYILPYIHMNFMCLLLAYCTDIYKCMYVHLCTFKDIPQFKWNFLWIF